MLYILTHKKTKGEKHNGKFRNTYKKAEEMEKLLNELKAEIKNLTKWEMKPRLDDEEDYYYLEAEGVITKDWWGNLYEDTSRFEFGNVFETEQEAELEVERRKLLARFRAFRNECNEGWKPYWTDMNEAKWSVILSEGKLLALSMYANNSFDTFGHFKNQEDCQKAIEIFGEEIIELFVEA